MSAIPCRYTAGNKGIWLQIGREKRGIKMNNPENKDIFMSVQLLSDETEESVIGISKKKNQYDDLPKYSSTKTW